MRARVTVQYTLTLASMGPQLRRFARAHIIAEVGIEVCRLRRTRQNGLQRVGSGDGEGNVLHGRDIHGICIVFYLVHNKTKTPQMAALNCCL